MKEALLQPEEHIGVSDPPLAYSARLNAAEAFRLAGVFLLLTVSLFAKVLFSHGQQVLGYAGNDLTSHVRYLLQFGFDHLRHGQLVLWNPYSFCGYPFFGSWQAGLLYPPNWIHLFLSWPVAVNCTISFHFFLLAWLTSVWCRYRGISFTGSILAGLIAVGSGGLFTHIYAGHLSFLAVAAWTPLIFLCIDGLLGNGHSEAREDSEEFENPRIALRWVLLGIAAVSMQILAGFPQIVYYTALIGGIYALIQLPASRHPLRTLGGIFIIYAFSGGITAVQLLAGFHASGESVRAGGAAMELAATYSMPPENFLTLIAPHLFGDLHQFPYFGRWFFWETSLFVGSAGFCLALCGSFHFKNPFARAATILALLTSLLALGSYTPLFPLLYRHVPLYSDFRAHGRFGFFVATFLAILAGIGYDRLRAGRLPPRFIPTLLLVTGVILSLAGLGLMANHTLGNRFWLAVLNRLNNTGQTMALKLAYVDDDFRKTAPLFMSQQIALAGLLLSAAATMLFLSRRRPMVYALAIVAAVEILGFDVFHMDTQPADMSMPAAWQSAIAATPPGQRVYVPSPIYTNSGVVLGQHDIFGYDPCIPKRFAEFIALSQDHDPNRAGYMLFHAKISPLFKLLRLGLFIGQDDQPATTIVPNPMPQASIVHHWQLAPSRDDCFAAMKSAKFDPTQTVLLETTPQPLPAESASNDSVQIIRQGTDDLEITATLQKPGILLITDSYSSGWRALPLDHTSQTHYDVLPADWTLRAVPLMAGQHHFRMQYSPKPYRIGKYISLASLLIYWLWFMKSLLPTRFDQPNFLVFKAGAGRIPVR